MQDDAIVAMTVRFPKRILDAARARADEDERPLNTTIIRALRAYLGLDPKETKKKGG